MLCCFCIIMDFSHEIFSLVTWHTHTHSLEISLCVCVHRFPLQHSGMSEVVKYWGLNTLRLTHTHTQAHRHQIRKAVMVLRDLAEVFSNTAWGCCVAPSIHPSIHPSVCLFTIHSYISLFTSLLFLVYITTHTLTLPSPRSCTCLCKTDITLCDCAPSPMKRG